MQERLQTCCSEIESNINNSSPESAFWKINLLNTLITQWDKVGIFIKFEDNQDFDTNGDVFNFAGKFSVNHNRLIFINMKKKETSYFLQITT